MCGNEGFSLGGQNAQLRGHWAGFERPDDFPGVFAAPNQMGDLLHHLSAALPAIF
jgi:hypothetical protein